MATEINLKETEKVLKALANRRRLAILKFLKHKGEQAVTDIADEINLSIKATSKHLSKLRAIGLVDFEQRGALFFYHLHQLSNPITKRIVGLL